MSRRWWERRDRLDSWQSVATAAWPLVQSSMAAVAAWTIALRIAGHPGPFFAPVAALVALSAPRGERGLQAVRLILGVVLGILIGELTAAFLGAGFGRIGLAAFMAMMLAHVAGGARLTIVQAGVGAILTVIAADGEAGINRAIDALLGGGVALVFSQVLFSPEPVTLLRRAEMTALEGLADGLSRTARAVETGDDDTADDALKTLRDVRDPLAEVARLRIASRNIALRSAMWRSQRDPLVRERENADHLDLLGGSCVMLARALFEPDLMESESLRRGLEELADSASELAQAPGDRDVRQRAADRSLGVARSLADLQGEPGSSTALAISMLRVVSTDLMVFAGVDFADAVSAVQQAGEDLKVPKPPATPRAPFGLDRWWR